MSEKNRNKGFFFKKKKSHNVVKEKEKHYGETFDKKKVSLKTKQNTLRVSGIDSLSGIIKSYKV